MGVWRPPFNWHHTAKWLHCERQRNLATERYLIEKGINMPESRVSRYPVGKLEEYPTDVRDRMTEVQNKAGFIPNVFLALAHRPAEFRAFFDYHDALMLKESGLSKAEREMIVVATSAANDCHYCVIAHGAILRLYSKDAFIADQLAVNYRKANVTSRQSAMLEFAVKMARTPEQVNEADRGKLFEYGFTDEDVWDIAAISAFFALSNRMAHLTDMQPNDEFYSMGRGR